MPKYPFKKREHLERVQPKRRRHLGVLEKHQDYVQRARDHHAKQARLRSLKEQARSRNPDEFYFKMQRSRIGRDGVHRQDASQTEHSYTPDEMRLMLDEDASYLRMRRSVDLARAERMEAELHMTDAPMVGTHTVFVEDDEAPEDGAGEDEVREMLAQRFDTVKEAVESRVRPTRAQLEGERLVVGGVVEDGGEEVVKRKYEEVSERRERAQRLLKMAQDMETRRALTGKGRRIKRVNTKTGAVQFVWHPERKR